MGIFALLRENFPLLHMEEDFSLSRHTTIGCGGKVSVSASPSDAEEAAELLSFLRRVHIPYAYLGAGADTLPQDEDTDAVLIRSDRLKALTPSKDALFAGAGVTGGALLRYAMAHESGGFEPFAGIPMTVGGATVMNAGVAEGHISDLALRVLAVDGGRIRTFPLSACGFGEKTSVFQEGIFVVGVLFRTRPSSPERIRRRISDFLDKRRGLPKGRSMGCTFVNPEGESAGKIIDDCGLKGRRIGGAYVSELHANFIINEGGTSSDVASLIDLVKDEVFRKRGILLREEIRRLSFSAN